MRMREQESSEVSYVEQAKYNRGQEHSELHTLSDPTTTTSST